MPTPRPSRRAPHRLAALALAGVTLLALAPSVAAAETLSFVAEDGTRVTIAAAVTPEQYYLKLLNCSRTGGYVASDGRCIGYGTGRYSTPVPAITYSWGLTTKVARPYAKLLATKARCAHDLGGDPGDRFRRAGYRPSAWGENIGCRDGSSVYASVLASHRAFQAEKASNGGHWRNIKNSRYRYVGIGIYKYGSRIRLVVDFYRPA